MARWCRSRSVSSLVLVGAKTNRTASDNTPDAVTRYKVCNWNLTLRLNIAQKPDIVWSFCPKALKSQSLEPLGYKVYHAGVNNVVISRRRAPQCLHWPLAGTSNVPTAVSAFAADCKILHSRIAELLEHRSS